MDTIFMSSENTKTSEYHVLVLKLTDKLDLRIGQKNCCFIHGKNNNKFNKFKISAPTWNEEFELPDGSYSISHIQDYFEYFLKKHSESVDSPRIRIY